MSIRECRVIVRELRKSLDETHQSLKVICSCFDAWPRILNKNRAALAFLNSKLESVVIVDTAPTAKPQSSRRILKAVFSTTFRKLSSKNKLLETNWVLLFSDLQLILTQNF